MIEEHDIIVLCHDLDEYGLRRGDIGAIVHCYKDSKAYEVEFVTGESETLAVVSLESKNVRSMTMKEILHVRELQVAA